MKKQRCTCCGSKERISVFQKVEHADRKFLVKLCSECASFVLKRLIDTTCEGIQLDKLISDLTRFKS